MQEVYGFWFAVLEAFFEAKPNQKPETSKFLKYKGLK